MGGSRKFHQGNLNNVLFSHLSISQRAIQASLEKQLDPMGKISSLGVSIPELLRKPISTCDFPGQSGPPDPSLDLSMINVQNRGQLMRIWSLSHIYASS